MQGKRPLGEFLEFPESLSGHNLETILKGLQLRLWSDQWSFLTAFFSRFFLAFICPNDALRKRYAPILHSFAEDWSQAAREACSQSNWNPKLKRCESFCGVNDSFVFRVVGACCIVDMIGVHLNNQSKVQQEINKEMI